MKTRFTFRRFVVGAVALLTVGFSAAQLSAQVKPTHRPELPNFDKRAQEALDPQDAAARQKGKAHFSNLLPGAVLDEDPLLHSPKFIRSHDGFLTGPNGRGRGVSAQAAQSLPSNDPHAAIKAFLNEHSSLFGHDSSVLGNARVKRNYVDAHNGLRTVVYEQQLDGIPVHDGILLGHITKDGELTSLSSLFVANAAGSANRGTPGRAMVQKAPAVSAEKALAIAAQNIGSSQLEISRVGGPDADGGYERFKTPDSAGVRKVWLPVTHQSLRLAWDVIVVNHGTRELFQLVVDAVTGEVHIRKRLTQYFTDATYNVYTSDSPSPFSPGLQTPGTFQPPLTSRTMVTTPGDVIASPDGWIPDSGNSTTGNNVDAFADRDFNSQPDRPRPAGNPNRVFDFPLDLTLDPTNYLDASTVNFFYRGNWYHDQLYALGFTEAAGNFQQNNFGRGGLGNDPVIAYVQAGADLGVANNAMFGTPPDGMSGECYMFIWDFPNPARDGSLDAEVMMHELTHGTSWRLVGGGMGLGNLQGDGMGEGWSDFYALSLLTESGDDPNAAYVTGGYVTYRLGGLLQNYYYGIRAFPYSTDMSKNPLTFKDIDPNQISPHTGVPRSPISPFDPRSANEVHNQGEVWCATVWELRANLMVKYGYAGNQLALQLVTDGMKLTPAYPNFLQARDAILLADRINNAGANVGEIWRAFAKRGMGFSATSPNGNSTAGVHEAFDVPGLQVDHVVVNGGNGNGGIDPNECDDLQVFLANTAGFLATGVSAELTTTTPGIIVVQATATYPPIPNNSTNENLTPFRISIAPWFICGTPIDFTLSIKSDQATAITQFRVATGRPNPPTRFDNLTPVAIPDGDLNGTNSVIVVSNITSAINKVTVSLHITHTYDQDLTIQLISPEGITNTLSRHHGYSGNNYGLGCADNLRTTFDDSSTNNLNAANPPFVGTFVPDSPLYVFEGKFGTNVNGPWLLHVVDDYRIDTGNIECWSLLLTTASCTEGPGECPGADLGVGMTALPEPVILGNNLNYTISVTNSGPSLAKNVVLTQILPTNTIYSSGNASQGTVSAVGRVVTCTLGQMYAGTRATINVSALTFGAGLAFCSATASSEQPDFKPANNSASVLSHVSPRTADMGVTLSVDPISVVLGGTATWSLVLSNNGPSSASGFVTNVLPANVAVVSASISQGSIATPAGNTVVCQFGSLTNGGRATASITTTAVAEGQGAATATLIATEFDPIAQNNSASATITVGPAADLAIGILDTPDPALTGSNITYLVTVANLGPSLATSVTVNETLPPNVRLVDTNSSQGVITVAGNTVTCTLGTLLKGATATVSVKVVSTNTGTLNTTVNVVSALADPNTANNSANASTRVDLPFVAVAGAGATLTMESVAANGAIDAGETVTAILRLRNSGNVAATNLMATLLATNGITPVAPNDPQRYGVLPPSGFAVGKPFTFTASGPNGGTVTAVLQITDGANTYPPVSFSFVLPNVHSFTNPVAISIPEIGSADPYPSTIAVSGLTGSVGKTTATLQEFVHGFPHDVNVLLVAPSSAKSILMSHAAAQNNFGSNMVTLTFDDSAAAPIPASGQLSSGTFRPAAYGDPAAFLAPAPSEPYPVGMASFNAKDPNGIWSLYVNDDVAGDAGAVVQGWYLTITTLTPVNQNAELQLTALAPTACVAGSNITCIYTITNAGPNPATFVSFTNLLPAGVTVVSSTVSQGTNFVVGGSIVASLDTLNTGVTATVTVVLNVGASAVGTLVNSAGVSANETDLNLLNNIVSLPTTVTLPEAEIAILKAVVNTNVVLIGSNLTFTTIVTNSGPGIALDVAFTNAIPAGLSYVSANASQGTVAAAGSTIVGQLGNIPPQSAATVLVVLGTTAIGTVTNPVVVATRSVDSAAGNSASAVVTVSSPVPRIAIDSVLVTSESRSPANGAVDANESVSVSIALKNTGSAGVANCSAILLGTAGITPVGPVQKTYGALPISGAVVANTFSFVAGASGSGVTVTLQLTDGLADLGTVSAVLNFPAHRSDSNPAAIAIPDHGPAAPYPSTITISGVTGLVSKAVVTLNGLTHSFPRDVNVLLVGPAGGKALLMSHAGGAFGITNRNLIFDDSAVNSLPFTNQVPSGTFKPTAFGTVLTFPWPAPASPYPVSLGALNGSSPNGTWSLYVLDDSSGDLGQIASGWTLDLTIVETQNPVTDLAVSLSSSPASLYVGLAFTNVITVTNLGPAAATGVFITNTLSEGVAFVSSSLSQGSATVGAGTVVWNVGSLPVGGSARALLSLTPWLSGTISSAAGVVSEQVDLNQINNSSVASITAARENVELHGYVTNSQFHLDVTGEPNLTYVILASTNLSSWVRISTNTASPGGTIKFVDPAAMGKARFYRAQRLVP